MEIYVFGRRGNDVTSLKREEVKKELGRRIKEEEEEEVTRGLKKEEVLDNLNYIWGNAYCIVEGKLVKIEMAFE